MGPPATSSPAPSADEGAGADDEAAVAPPQPATAEATLSRAEVVAAIVKVDGNVSAAARELGLQRTQLRRLLVRYQINVQKLRDLT